MPQELVFTTLPHLRAEINGEPVLKLSVFVSVKLSTPKDTTLKEFEDILAWPQKMLDADFAFKLEDGTVMEAEMAKEQIDTELFSNIFHGDIKVDDFKEEDFSKRNIHSFPIKHINDFVLKNYRDIAVNSPKRLVAPEKFVDETTFGAISRMKLDPDAIEKAVAPRRMSKINSSELFFKNDNDDRAVRNDLKRNKFRQFSAKMEPKTDFIQMRQFHKIDKNVITRLAPVVLEKPAFEFHDILSVANSYPQIMRKLGFVLDFIIPYQPSIPNSGTITLAVNSLEFEEEGTTISVPTTAYSITPSGFYTADKPGTIFRQGFVKINTDEFSVVQIDADGTALKTHGMAENKVQEIARFYEVRSELSVSRNLKLKEIDEVEPPQDEGLPYMRSAGIAIIKNGMAEHLFNRMENNLNLKQVFSSTKIESIQLYQKASLPNIQPATQNPQPVNVSNQALQVQNPQLLGAKLKFKLPAVKLYSNDIIQGYRMDIAYESEPAKWYSLHQRSDEYTWYDESNQPHQVLGIIPDEGYIQLGLAEDPNDPDDVFVSETLARWEGWSLSVRKPGLAINESEDYELKDGETVKRDFVHKNKQLEIKKYEFDPDLEFKINAQSKIVAGTLPKLRYGKDYRVRVRAVDLAGNSVPLSYESESPTEIIRANIRYKRYEPLASPIVLVGNELKDGEFLECLVVRSNFGQSAKEYEKVHPVQGKKLDNFSQRYLLPPKNSQSMAEAHNKFDKAFQNNSEIAAEIYNIITNHEGLYVQDEKNKEKIYQPSEVEIIYLPDPMAAGVSLFVAEGFDNTHTQEFKPRMFSFFRNDELNPDNTNQAIPDDWYNAGAIRVRLEEGEQGTKWDSSERVFTVSLPKGIRTRIKFSTFWRWEDLNELSAIWQMIQEENPSNLSELKKLASAGQHWMVSPPREFELVHAVQQPVDAPVIRDLIPDRDYNTTFALINTRFDIHGESTEKVEFQAKWTEPSDDGISVRIKEKQGRNSIPDIQVNYHDDIVTKGTIPEPQMIARPPVQNLKEMPILRFQPRTFTQFEADPQPQAKRANKLYQAQNANFKKLEQAKVSAKVNLAGRVKYDIESVKFGFVKQMNLRIKPLEHQFGDTKHRWVDYKLIATSRYREYFDKILNEYSDLTPTRESEWKERVNILSSARPQPPVVDYVIPTFEWRKTQSGEAIRHQRLGGGLRIYLKRPWYSSGADEMLGVLLPDQKLSTTALTARAAGYSNLYTHWGIDPVLYGTRPADVSPDVSDFRMNPVIDDKLEYPDTPGRMTKAVAYPVFFDQERQLWFCDLAIDPKGMYFPFIRLMLARYQPHSVRETNSDVCLSSVVTAKMIQLMPDRQSTLRFKKDDLNSKFSITIEGTIYNPGDTPYGNFNFVKISLLDSRVAQPIYGIVDDGSNNKNLGDEGVTIEITRKDYLGGNRFSIEREFRLPKDYKTAPFQVIIEEYERGPSNIPGLPNEYKARLEQSEQTDRLVYADVFKINGVD